MFSNTSKSQNESLLTHKARVESKLEQKDRQIQYLSKNLRKWSRKYNELERSVSDSTLDVNEFEAENKHLRGVLIKLKRKNEMLELRLAEMQNKISNHAKKVASAPDVLEIQLPEHTKENNDEFHEEIINDNEPMVELEFSDEMKAVLAKYTDNTNVQ